MAQRANIILNLENSNGNKVTRIYYTAWGIGKVMPMAIMEFISNLSNASNVRATELKLNTFNSAFIEDISLAFDEDGKYDDINFDDCKTPQGVKHLIEKYSDNNNGAIVLNVIEKKANYDYEYDFEIGFLIGHEDEDYIFNDKEYNVGNPKAFEEWVTYEEWYRIVVEEYSRTTKNNGVDFKDLFLNFLKFFDVEILK